MRRDQVVVEVQGTIRVDAALQVGEMGQVVEVKSDVPLLQIETSSLGHMVQSRAVLEMPLNGRNVMNLVALAPGVIPIGITTLKQGKRVVQLAATFLF